MSANILYSVLQNFYLSGLFISFFSPDTLIDKYYYDEIYFLFLLTI